MLRFLKIKLIMLKALRLRSILRMTSLVAIALCICSVDLSAQSDEPGRLYTEAGIAQLLHYSKSADFDVSAIQSDTLAQLSLGWFLSPDILSIQFDLGYRISPPPTVDEYFSVRGFAGLQSRMLLRLYAGSAYFGVGAGFDVYRYWNTSVRFMTPGLSATAGFPVFQNQSETLPVLFFAEPLVNMNFRPDTQVSISAGLMLRARLKSRAPQTTGASQ